MVAKRLVILLVPLLLTPLLLFLVAEGILNFGGGEKDIFLLLPWGLWALLFLITGLALWRRSRSTRNWAIKSFLYSLGVLLALWLILLAYSVVMSL